MPGWWRKGNGGAKAVTAALAAVIVVLLAIQGVGKAHVAQSATTPTSTPQTVGTDRPASGGAPQQVLLVPKIPPLPGPASTTTTAPTAKPASVVATTTTVAAAGPCTAQDVAVTTATDAPQYAPGATVTVTTQLRDLVTCQFTPAPSSNGGCDTDVTIVDSQGHEVFPVTDQAVKCASVPAGVLQPGSVATVVLHWTQQVVNSDGSSGPAPPGSYSAVGTWNWAAAGGAASATAKAPFTLVARH